MDIIAGYIYVHRTWLNNGVRLYFRWKGFFYIGGLLEELSLDFLYGYHKGAILL